MQDVVLLQPGSLREAAQLASQHGREASYLAGGQDLLYRLKRRLVKSPRYLIDLKRIPELASITIDGAGGLRIGPLTPLYRLAESDVVSRNFPALAAASSSIASPQIRNVGTVGGNLCQDVWCCYLLEDYACNLNGGSYCPAAVGEFTSYHAAVAQKRCVAVHPSDLAPALLALDARVGLSGADGSRTLPIDELLPGLTGRAGEYRINALRPGEIVTEILVPAPRAGQRQAFVKNRFRQCWDFSVVSAAASLVIEDGVCQTARAVLGGVALHPWRAAATEAYLIGQPFDQAACTAAADRVLSGARLLPQGSYKLALARELTRTVLESLLAGD